MPPQYLDSRVKLAWFIPTVIALLVIWLIATVAVFGLANDEFVFGLTKPLFSIVLFIFLGVVVGGPVYLYNHVEYMSFTFELAEHEFIIRQGVITRHTTVIPYNRIQNINTTRTLLERILGLASLQIETAGSNPHTSEGELPGVSKKDVLISEIMQRVERTKKARILPNGTVKSEQEVLGDILKELRELNNSIKHGSLRHANGKTKDSDTK